MAVKVVKIGDVADSLQMLSDDIEYYYLKDTIEIVMITSEELEYIDSDIEDLPEWQKELVEVARKVSDELGTNSIKLPNRFEVNEYRMMEEFIDSLSDETIADKLDRAIRGRGAFARFKDIAYRFGIEDMWYSFKDKCYEKIAIEWCEENNIKYEI